MPLPLTGWQGIAITAGIVVYDWLLIWRLRRLIVHYRSWWTFIVTVMLVSPVPLVIIAWAVEHRPPWTLLDPNRQSWALFADVALAAALAVCAHAWQNMPYEVQLRYTRATRSRPGHRGRHRWLLISLMLGLALAGAFRWNESRVYDLYRYMSYTKLFHDLVSYVVLATMLIFAAWPVLRRKLDRVGIWRRIATKFLVLALLAVWVLGGVHDYMHGVNPAFLHPRTPSAEQFDPRPTDVTARFACKIPGR